MGQLENHRTSLLKVNHQYIFKQRIFTEEFYRRLLFSKFSIRGTMIITCHVLVFLAKLKRFKQGDISWKKSLYEEAWRQLLLCSQEFNPIQKAHKTYTIVELQGVKVAKFRLNPDNHLLGADYLPILDVKSVLGRKLLHKSHLNPVMRFLPIHRTINGSLAELERGPYGVLIPGAKGYLQEISIHCGGCNQQRTIYYTPQLGTAYTMMGGKKVF